MVEWSLRIKRSTKGDCENHDKFTRTDYNKSESRFCRVQRIFVKMGKFTLRKATLKSKGNDGQHQQNKINGQWKKGETSRSKIDS